MNGSIGAKLSHSPSSSGLLLAKTLGTFVWCDWGLVAFWPCSGLEALLLGAMMEFSNVPLRCEGSFH